MKHECFEVELRDDTRKVSRQTFDGTNELAKYIKTAKTNDLWKGHTQSSKTKKTDDYDDWNDFNTLEDATQALEYGTDIYYKDFKKNMKRVQDFLSKREKSKMASYKNDKVGFLPIVPKVLQGNPINMINHDIKPKPYPTARVIIEKSNSCAISSSTMNEFYAIIFVLIQLLESRGIRCEVWVTETSCKYSEIVCTRVKLKNYTQPLNTYKIQFPIIASDFLRRICFRMIETNPDITETWYHGYGRPLIREFSLKDHKKEIYEAIGVEENDIYIPSCQHFCYSKGDDLEEIIEKILEQTNLKNYIKLTE